MLECSFKEIKNPLYIKLPKVIYRKLNTEKLLLSQKSVINTNKETILRK